MGIPFRCLGSAPILCSATFKKDHSKPTEYQNHTSSNLQQPCTRCTERNSKPSNRLTLKWKPLRKKIALNIYNSCHIFAVFEVQIRQFVNQKTNCLSITMYGPARQEQYQKPAMTKEDSADKNNETASSLHIIITFQKRSHECKRSCYHEQEIYLHHSQPNLTVVAK